MAPSVDSGDTACAALTSQAVDTRGLSIGGETMEKDEFNAACAELLAVAKQTVRRLEGITTGYWDEMSGGMADYLRDDAHRAHKLAVKIAKEFED
jgi:hypothetical protein